MVLECSQLLSSWLIKINDIIYWNPDIEIQYFLEIIST